MSNRNPCPILGPFVAAPCRVGHEPLDGAKPLAYLAFHGRRALLLHLGQRARPRRPANLPGPVLRCLVPPRR